MSDLEFMLSLFCIAAATLRALYIWQAQVMGGSCALHSMVYRHSMYLHTYTECSAGTCAYVHCAPRLHLACSERVPCGRASGHLHYFSINYQAGQMHFASAHHLVSTGIPWISCFLASLLHGSWVPSSLACTGHVFGRRAHPLVNR